MKTSSFAIFPIPSGILHPYEILHFSVVKLNYQPCLWSYPKEEILRNVLVWKFLFYKKINSYVTHCRIPCPRNKFFGEIFIPVKRGESTDLLKTNWSILRSQFAEVWAFEVEKLKKSNFKRQLLKVDPLKIMVHFNKFFILKKKIILHLLGPNLYFYVKNRAMLSQLRES